MDNDKERFWLKRKVGDTIREQVGPKGPSANRVIANVMETLVEQVKITEIIEVTLRADPVRKRPRRIIRKESVSLIKF